MPQPVESPPRPPTEAWTSLFEEFFAEGAPAAACAPLGAGACVHLSIESPPHPPANLAFLKNNAGQIIMIEGPPPPPQASLTFSAQLAREVLTLKSDEISDFGLLILRAFLERPRRLQAKIHVGFIELWRKGWFGVLTLGGGRVASYLASQGLNGIGGIQRALKALRSESSHLEKEPTP